MGYWSLSPEAGSRHKMCPSVNCNKEWYTVCSVITVHITISLYCWIYKKSQLLVVFIPNWNHPSYKIKKNNNNNLLPLSVPLLLCSNTAVFWLCSHIFHPHRTAHYNCCFSIQALCRYVWISSGRGLHRYQPQNTPATLTKSLRVQLPRFHFMMYSPSQIMSKFNPCQTAENHKI